MFDAFIFSVPVSHTKVTVSVTKSLHQNCDLCYLLLPIFFLHIHSPLLLENKKVVVIAVSLSKLDQDHYSMIYIMRVF